MAEQDPYYSSETNETVWHIIADFIAPRVDRRGVSDHPRDCFRRSRRFRGHNMAKAAVEMAAWDPLRETARRAVVPRPRRPPFASESSGGQARRTHRSACDWHQPSLDDLAAKVSGSGGGRLPAQSRSRSRPGWDLDPVEMIRVALRQLTLMVDANAAYTRADADHPRGSTRSTS